MNLDDYTCRLCWTKCAGPGDLAQHEQQEHDSDYELPVTTPLRTRTQSA